ncbi:hypothetical protein D3C77_649260 [compost metagenome]
MRNQFRDDARVGAGNEHGAGVLGSGQAFEQILLFGKHFITEAFESLDNTVQCLVRILAGRTHLNGNGLVLVRHRAVSSEEVENFSIA